MSIFTFLWGGAFLTRGNDPKDGALWRGSLIFPRAITAVSVVDGDPALLHHRGLVCSRAEFVCSLPLSLSTTEEEQIHPELS
jgi:hypothetical protein